MRRILISLVLLSVMSSGCHQSLLILRGRQAAAAVNHLGTTSAPDSVYTFRWLRRPGVGEQSQSRFDGVVVDLYGRQLHVVRRSSGEHTLLLRDAGTDDGRTLTMPAKELSTLQAVVRQYRFRPYVLLDPAGIPQVIVYAPVPTHLSFSRGQEASAWRLDIYRGDRSHHPTAGVPDLLSRYDP